MVKTKVWGFQINNKKYWLHIFDKEMVNLFKTERKESYLLVVKTKRTLSTHLKLIIWNMEIIRKKYNGTALHIKREIAFTCEKLIGLDESNTKKIILKKINISFIV